MTDREPSPEALEIVEYRFRSDMTVRELALQVDKIQREARTAAIEEAARLAAGEPYHEIYRMWPWFGNGNRANDDNQTKFADALAQAIRALATPNNK